MKQKNRQIFYLIIFFIFTSCNERNEKKNLPKIERVQTEKSKFIPNEKFLTKHSDSCKCSCAFEPQDSFKLEHIKDQFYKSKTGHLYEKTWSQRGLKEQDTLIWVLYFNGSISQEIDPLTFEEMNCWYAKDKKNIYYYRPTSGGMQNLIMKKANRKTFEILKGHYKYAKDRDYFFDDGNIIEDFIPSKTKLYEDNKKRIYKMICNNKTYNFEIVN